jgi:hypothetical protein
MWKRLVSISLLCLLYCVSSPGQVINAWSSPQALDAYPYIDLSDTTKAHAQQQISLQQKERAARNDYSHAPPLFNEQDPAMSGKPRITEFRSHGDFDPLFIKESTLIVIGKILTAKPHLSQSKGWVYSTFNFSPSKFLRGYLPGTLLLEREGGVVLFPTREKRLIGVSTFGLPVPGGTYVFFLKPSPSGDSYIILGGYSLGGTHVLALDREGAQLEILSDDALLSTIQNKLPKPMAQ